MSNISENIINNFSKRIKELGSSIGRETLESIHAAKILIKILKNTEVSKEEIIFLKHQSLDIAKAISLLGLQFIPGSSIAIIVLEKSINKYGFSLFPKKHEIPHMNEIRKIVRETLCEFVSYKDLKDVKDYADLVFSKEINVEFTNHFLDRVNDPRNGDEITPEELKMLYKKAHDKYARNLANLKNGDERVINDVQTDINIPVVISGTKPDVELVAKTVMRKKNFLTPPMSPKLKV